MNHAQDFIHNLDLDRLHAVIEKPAWSLFRGEGKTMGIIARMVGEALVGDGFRYLYIGEREWIVRDISRSLRQILHHNGVEGDLEYKGRRLIIDQDGRDKCFEFISIGCLSHNTLNGMYLDSMWVDLSDHTTYDSNHRRLLDEARRHIRPEYR